MSVISDEDSLDDDPIILLKTGEERVLNINPQVNDFNKQGEDNKTKTNKEDMIDVTNKSLRLENDNIWNWTSSSNEQNCGKKIDFKRNIGLVGMKITNFKVKSELGKTTSKLILGKKISDLDFRFLCSKDKSEICSTEKKKKSQNKKPVTIKTVKCSDKNVKKDIEPKVNMKESKKEKNNTKTPKKSKNNTKNLPKENNVTSTKKYRKTKVAKEITNIKGTKKCRKNVYNIDGTEDYCIKDSNLGKQVCDKEEIKKALICYPELPAIMDKKNSQNDFHLNKLKPVSCDPSLKAKIPDWANLTKNYEIATEKTKKQTNMKNKIPRKGYNVKRKKEVLCKQNNNNIIGTINNLSDNSMNHPLLNSEMSKCSSGTNNVYIMNDWCKKYKYFCDKQLSQNEKQIQNQMIPNNLWFQNRTEPQKSPIALNNFPFFLPGVPLSTFSGQKLILTDKNRSRTEVPPPNYKIIAMPQAPQFQIAHGKPRGPNILLSNNKFTSVSAYKSKQGIVLSNLKEAIKQKKPLNRVLVTLPLMNHHHTPKSDEMPSICGYSPPILPIPSYQNYLELMSSTNNNAKNREMPGTTDVVGTNTVSHSMNTSSVNVDLVKKRKHDLEEAKLEAVSNKAVKRISLQEYKKRCFKGDDTCIDLTKRDGCGEYERNEINVDKCKNDESDNGYDSDITVKL